MKRIGILTVAIGLALLSLTACGTYEFSGDTEESGKLATITAVNAGKDDFFVGGSLEVADGEEIVMTPSLTKGSIRVELFEAPGEQSAEEIPELNDEANIAADLSGTDSASYPAPAGTYLLKASCLEKADGTVQIEVKPAE